VSVTPPYLPPPFSRRARSPFLIRFIRRRRKTRHASDFLSHAWCRCTLFVLERYARRLLFDRRRRRFVHFVSVRTELVRSNSYYIRIDFRSISIRARFCSLVNTNSECPVDNRASSAAVSSRDENCWMTTLGDRSNAGKRPDVSIAFGTNDHWLFRVSPRNDLLNG